MKREPEVVKAAEVIYVVLCKDGMPHQERLTSQPYSAPLLSHEDASTYIKKIEADGVECGPHRAQAYRPMR